MDHYIVGKIVDQVSDVLWSKLSLKHLTVPNHDRVLDTVVKYEERWVFPDVFSCTDGKHNHIKCPMKAGSLLYNYRHFFSVVVHGVSEFVLRDIVGYGKQIDGGTFSAPTLYHFLEDFELPCQSLQVLREVKQKCLFSSLVMRCIL